MKKIVLKLASLVIAVCSTAGIAPGQTREKVARPAAKPAQATSVKTASAAITQPPKLGEADANLVRDSKSAIVATGISEDYFDAHFTLQKVLNTSGDHRVVWLFRVNEHEAVVSDTIGFYTNESGKRVNTHSIASALSEAHDITRTISRRRAERIMRSCIGPFESGTVIYSMTGAPRRATLIFTATSITRRKSRAELEREEREREKREAHERRERERAAKRNGRVITLNRDVIEDEDEGGGPPIFIGSVDLETGSCAKGQALSGPPPSEKAPRTREPR